MLLLAPLEDDQGGRGEQWSLLGILGIYVQHPGEEPGGDPGQYPVL
jgi:hypothetical protein